jgi:transaldolase
MKKLKTEIYLDGANIKAIKYYQKSPIIKGFTTNPSLMAKEKVKDYFSFAKQILSIEKRKPISFEVFADTIAEMKKQACEISSWGKNVFVKIPITNTKGIKTYRLINELNNIGIKCNVTAIFTYDQLKEVVKNNEGRTKNILSVFAGRIADTGIDPMPILQKMKSYLKNKKQFKLLWASPREIFNIIQASKINCDIITVPYEMLPKLSLFKKNLNKYSIETVKMFYNDAKRSNYKIKITK